MVKREEQKLLTLFQRIQPANKQDILDHAEALNMDLIDSQVRILLLQLADQGIIKAGPYWEWRILTAEERGNVYTNSSR